MIPTFERFISVEANELNSRYTITSLLFNCELARLAVLKCSQSFIAQGCCHSSVDSSAPTILPPQVRVQTTLLSFKAFVLYQSCEKDKNKQKEAGFGQFKKVYKAYEFLTGCVSSAGTNIYVQFGIKEESLKVKFEYSKNGSSASRHNETTTSTSGSKFEYLFLLPQLLSFFIMAAP